MVGNKLDIGVVAQALYTTAYKTAEKKSNKNDDIQSKTFDLDGYIKLRSRFMKKTAVDSQIYGVDGGLEYYTVLPFSAIISESSAVLKKPLEIADFMDTIYRKTGKWSIRSKDIDTNNILLYQNICKVITDDLAVFISDVSSEKSLIDMLERKRVKFGYAHKSSGFPTDYLDSLLKIYETKKGHGISLTKSKVYNVQFRETINQRKVEKSFINNYGQDSALDPRISIIQTGYGFEFYARR